MSFFQLIEKRRSVRKFQKKPISDEQLRRILEAANSAPSAGDLQAYLIVVVRDKETKEKLVRAALGQEFIAEAPVSLIFCADKKRSGARYGQRGRDLYSIQDATIACTYAQLAAAELERGRVWVGDFLEEQVQDNLN